MVSEGWSGIDVQLKKRHDLIPNLLESVKGYKNFDLKNILETVFLTEHANKKVKHLSKGMKQRLNLAQSIIGDPKIILFDEPSNGFDCNSIDMFYSVLKKLSQKGSIVFLSSHHLTEIYGNVDKVFILSNGSIIKNIEIEKNDGSLTKEITIYLEDIKYETKMIIMNNFNEIKINENIIIYKGNINGIMSVITKIISLNLKINNIKIENKFLENILTKLQ